MIINPLNETIFFTDTGLDSAQTVRLVERGLNGADGGELYMEHSAGTNMVWRDGRLESNMPVLSEGFGLRYVVDDAAAYASGNDFSTKSLKSAARSVRDIQNYRPASGQTIALPTQQHTKPMYSETKPLLGYDEGTLIKILSDMDSTIRGKDQSIVQVSIGLAAALKAVTIIRKDGQRLDDVRPMVRFTVNLLARDEKTGKVSKGNAGYAARGTLARFFNEHGTDLLCEKALQALGRSKIAVPAPAGMIPVILGNGGAAVMLHEAVGHSLEGDANRIGASVFSGRLGQRIAASGVTIIDQGDIPAQHGSLRFDDEGVMTQRNVLVEDGVLKGYMQDTMNARLMGVAPTGNGRRQSYLHKPIPRMTTTFMEAGQYSQEEIIASVKGRGILATGFGGGQVDPVSGKFVFDIAEGFLIEDGKIVAPIKDATLMGHPADALMSIDMIGRDLVIGDETWTCGKSGQSVPVGVGQPSLKMGGLTVGGTGPS